jgi:hypothetical protein
MQSMFSSSLFNGNISEWDVSQVENMYGMFRFSNFNEDISKWNVSNVENMHHIFESSKFNKDVSDWKPYRLIYSNAMFLKCEAKNPYWTTFLNYPERKKAIDTYHFNKDLNSELNENNTPTKKTKI